MRKQRGITFFGLLIILPAALFLIVTGMKLVPVYLEQGYIKRALTDISHQSGFANMSPKDVIEAFNTQASIDDIHSISGKDLDIQKERNQPPVVSVHYQAKVPLVANISLLVDFDAAPDTPGAK